MQVFRLSTAYRLLPFFEDFLSSRLGQLLPTQQAIILSILMLKVLVVHAIVAPDAKLGLIDVIYLSFVQVAQLFKLGNSIKSAQFYH